MSPDLKQNILYTIFFIILHNFSALFYFTGIVISTILLLLKPTRWKTFFLIGFIILLFGFEYNKHILEPLKEQTLNSLITIRPHYKVSRIVNLIMVKGLPLLLPLTGWSLLGIGTFLFIRGRKKNR